MIVDMRKRCIYLLLIILCANPAFANDLLGYWGFDGGENSGTMDLSGNNQHGQLLQTGEYLTGRYGLSLLPVSSETGSANPLIVDQLESFQIHKPFTVFLWVKLEQAVANGVLISTIDPESGAGFEFSLVNGYLQAVVQDNEGASIKVTTSAAFESYSTWIPLAVVYEGGWGSQGLHILRQGLPLTVTRQGQNSLTEITQSSPLVIGAKAADFDGESYYTNAIASALDEVRIYKRILGTVELRCVAAHGLHCLGAEAGEPGDKGRRGDPGEDGEQIDPKDDPKYRGDQGTGINIAGTKLFGSDNSKRFLQTTLNDGSIINIGSVPTSVERYSDLDEVDLQHYSIYYGFYNDMDGVPDAYFHPVNAEDPAYVSDDQTQALTEVETLSASDIRTKGLRLGYLAGGRVEASKEAQANEHSDSEQTIPKVTTTVVVENGVTYCINRLAMKDTPQQSDTEAMAGAILLVAEDGKDGEDAWVPQDLAELKGIVNFEVEDPDAAVCKGDPGDPGPQGIAGETGAAGVKVNDIKVNNKGYLTQGFKHGNNKSIASITSIDVDEYDVYEGVVDDSDDIADWYFHPKEKVILIHGDIITPIVVKADPQIIYNKTGFLHSFQLTEEEFQSKELKLVSQNKVKDFLAQETQTLGKVVGKKGEKGETLVGRIGSRGHSVTKLKLDSNGNLIQTYSETLSALYAFDIDHYDVYEGNVDGKSDRPDYYFHPKQRWVIIHGAVPFPVPIKSEAMVDYDKTGHAKPLELSEKDIAEKNLTLVSNADINAFLGKKQVNLGTIKAPKGDTGRLSRCLSANSASCPTGYIKIGVQESINPSSSSSICCK